MMGLTILVIVLLALPAVYGIAAAYGAAQWAARTRDLRARLDAVRVPVEEQTVDFSELEGLPGPVQRYLSAVLTEGQPVVTGVTLQHTGTFNMSATGAQWKPFTSAQWVSVHRPGFVWNGRVALLPGLPVRVHDAYLAGAGVLHAALLGLISVANLRGGGALAEGELMRYLAEAAWYPTALLPSQGVAWAAVDDHAAYGTLTDGDVAVTLLFTFNEHGLIDMVRAEARARMVDGESVPTPWHGRFWNFETQNGMRVPLDGEVAWELPDGEQPYWRGRITQRDYAWAQ